jgi:hypothetical protein
MIIKAIITYLANRLLLAIITRMIKDSPGVLKNSLLSFYVHIDLKQAWHNIIPTFYLYAIRAGNSNTCSCT